MQQQFIDQFACWLHREPPGFNLTAHLSRSAEIRSFDLAGHVRARQTVNLVRSTCALLRRPLPEDRANRRSVL